MPKLQKATLYGGVTELLAVLVCLVGFRMHIPGIEPYNVLNLPSNLATKAVVILVLFSVLTLLWFWVLSARER